MRKEDRASKNKEKENVLTEIKVQDNAQELDTDDKLINSSSYFTLKGMDEIKGCNDQLDPIGMLAFITQNEFQIRPNWVFKEKYNRDGSVC